MKRGFTIVELLVCIAIVGMLVALLIPAVVASREAARLAKCKSNLQQVGVAVASYLEHKGKYPSVGPSGRTLYERISDYTESDAVFGCPAWVDKGNQIPGSLPASGGYITYSTAISHLTPPQAKSKLRRMGVNKLSAFRLLSDEPDNHSLKGGNSLYADFHVGPTNSPR